MQEFGKMPLSPSLPVIGISLFWAGAVLSGNMIAAPAKFKVQDLSMDVALQVGRAQFTAIGYLEYTLMFLALLFMYLGKEWVNSLALIPTIAFLIQRLVILPQLNRRSDLIIAGLPAPDSHLHLVFIGFEGIKLLSLLGIGVWGVYQLSASRLVDILRNSSFAI